MWIIVVGQTYDKGRQVNVGRNFSNEQILSEEIFQMSKF